ncbi:MAG: hypothetical protein ABI184_00605 [Ginsengibacter sp.]
MKSQKPVASSQQFLKDNLNKNMSQQSYGNIIKIPLVPSTSIVSEEVTKKLFAIKDNAGLSTVENRMPLRLLLERPWQ